jgi:hypothetical protein
MTAHEAMNWVLVGLVGGLGAILVVGLAWAIWDALREKK